MYPPGFRRPGTRMTGPNVQGRTIMQVVPATAAPSPVAAPAAVAPVVAAPAAKPVAPAAPAAKVAVTTGGQGDTTGKVLTGLSVLQGIGGAISYATAQDPGQLPAPRTYMPPIRGAQGMEATSYEQGRRDILAGQTVASTADSSDVATTAVQRLLGQQQANRALAGLAAANNQQYQNDRGRQASEERGAYDTNYQANNQYDRELYGEKRRMYEARRTQSAAQVQGAIDQISGRWQQQAQQKQLKQESTNRSTESAITSLHTSLAAATTKEQTAALLAHLKTTDPTGAIYAKAVQLYGTRYGIPVMAGGGALPTGQMKWTTPKAASTGKGSLRTKAAAVPASVATFHKMSEEFGRHIDRMGQQSRAAFDRSIQTAIGLRSASGRTSTGAAFRPHR